MIPPLKTNMTGWKIHHEDVFPIEDVDFSNVMLVFKGVIIRNLINVFKSL